MILKTRSVAYLLCALLGLACAHAQDGAAHDKEFWKQIAKNDYRVPAGASPAALLDELTNNLGSPDPELRARGFQGLREATVNRRRWP